MAFGNVFRFSTRKAVCSHAYKTTLATLRARQDELAPIFARHRYWPKAIPQYNVGHGEYLAALGKMESGSAGLHFCANYRGGPGLSDCIDSALGISERVSADLGLKPS